MSVAWIDAPVLQGLRQGLAAEAGQPRPQPDVAGRRVLRLEAADLLDRLGDGQRRALQEELAGEQGAVQRALGEDPVGHRSSMMARRRGRRSSGGRAMGMPVATGQTPERRIIRVPMPRPTMATPTTTTAATGMDGSSSCPANSARSASTR